MKGYIHSIETFGTLDGPGVRYVIFTQGCPMRCQYCHNPDTWELNIGKQMSTDEILEDFDRYRPFLKDGGITVTGGEPLVQIDFVIELFEKAAKKDIHTCLDSSGITFNENNKVYLEKLNRLLEVTDLVMLDIKHINSDEHLKLTGHSNEQILKFARYLENFDLEVWIRHVVVPTITLNETYLYELGLFLGELRNIKALDVLPYHDMGKAKYEQLGIDYPLKHIEPLSKEEAHDARQIIIKGMREKRKELGRLPS